MSYNQANFREKVLMGDDFNHRKDDCDDDENSIES
jgi:hypothetical protein